MSREIKFRVWDNYLKSYEDNCENWENDSEELYLPPRMLFLESLKSLQKDSGRFVIEQFTGLKDKNGKEIYEGDIIKRRNFFVSGFERIEIEEYDISTVEWTSAGFWNFAVNDTNKTSALFEVIGNIHENPELLK